MSASAHKHNRPGVGGSGAGDVQRGWRTGEDNPNHEGRPQGRRAEDAGEPLTASSTARRRRSAWFRHGFMGHKSGGRPPLRVGISTQKGHIGINMPFCQLILVLPIISWFAYWQYWQYYRYIGIWQIWLHLGTFKPICDSKRGHLSYLNRILFTGMSIPT